MFLVSVVHRWVIAGVATAVAGAAAVVAVQNSGANSSPDQPMTTGRSTSSATSASAPSSPLPTGSSTPSPSSSPTGRPNPALRPATKPIDTRKGGQLGTPFTVNGIEVVSAKHRVSAGFRPKVSGSQPLTPAAAKAFARMSQAIRRAGLRVSIVSGYRSHASQAALYRHSLASYGRAYTVRYVAVPGTSEHQTGLAVDLRSPSGRGSTFDNTREWRWLRAHAQNYGFVLRYPQGLTKVTGIGFEPWHWRYVGVAQAKAIRALGPNTTIEQYLRLA